ncbi:Peptidase M1, partial [Pseudoloma neurophilia]
TTEEINEIFNPITYSKSSSLLRMIESAITPELFQKNIRRYMAHFQYGNAIADDLFRFLSDGTEYDLTDIMMNHWIRKPGYPILKFDGTEITQQRFSLEMDPKLSNWHILLPMIFVTEKNPTGQTTNSVEIVNMKNSKMNINEILRKNPNDLHLPSEVFLNNQGNCFCRVQYIQTDILKRLSSMSSINRLVFANDQWAFVKSNHISIDQYLEFCSSLRNETNPDILNSLLGSLLYLQRVLYPNNTAIVNMIKSLLRDRLNFSFTEEADSDVLRLRVIYALAAISVDQTLKIPKNCNPNYRECYLTQVYLRTKKVNPLIRQYLDSSTSHADREIICRVMARTRDLSTYKRVINFFFSKKIINQDLSNLNAHLSQNTQFNSHYFEHFVVRFKKSFSRNKAQYTMQSIIEDIMSFQPKPEEFATALKNANINEYNRFIPSLNKGREKAEEKKSLRENYKTAAM